MLRRRIIRRARVGWGREGDPGTVVGPDCRVVGVQGLRVVDASIMPSITSGNLNAPVVMMAEKAADMISGMEPLRPFDTEGR